MNLKKILLLGGVGLASATVGILLPTFVGSGHTEVAAKTDKPAGKDAAGGHDSSKEKGGHEEKKEAPAKADGHAAADHGGGHGGHGDDAPKKIERKGPQFLPFDQLVVNLNEPSLTKTLSIDVSVQTDGPFYDEVEAALKAKTPILKTWLTSHLADKSLEDIRGKVGVNRLRREIQDNFNSLLFKDGHERIQDIMFNEYHVQ